MHVFVCMCMRVLELRSTKYELIEKKKGKKIFQNETKHNGNKKRKNQNQN